MKQRSVYKITPARHATFDQQFWPVMVAVTVLCGICFGAIMTVARGPWLWGSLFALPLLAAGSVFWLFHLDDARLRRSLQFSIIVSLGMHLFILMAASLVNLFGVAFQAPEPELVQKPNVRTIEISDRRAAFVWEETNAKETPEPEVETEREEKPTAETKPQPIPVKETKPDPDPKLVRRKTPSETVPRQNRELSQLKRQTKDLKPQSSRQLTGQPTTAAQPTPVTREAKTAPNAASSARRAESIARRTENKPEPTESPSAPDAIEKPNVARANSSPRRTTPATQLAQSTPRPSPSSARIRRSSPRIPTTSTSAPVAEKSTKATTTASMSAEPSKAASQVTRRTAPSKTARTARSRQPKTELSPRTQAAPTLQTSRAQSVSPSISNPDSTSAVPRRSTTQANLASTSIPIENPSRAPESTTAARELNSKTVSVSRSLAGVAGAGKSSNLQRSVGGVTSPARRTSDSARRERPQSRSSDARMLTSSQASQTQRSVGAASAPSSSLKADTNSLAKLSGSRSPSEQTVESSAAQINSASTDSADDRSAEKGTASVDLGTTKIVADEQSRQRSGGGQPSVSQLSPESTRRSRERSSQQPSLVAAMGAESAAPSNLSSAPASSDSVPQPSSESSVASREGGPAAVSAERGTTEIVGEISDAGQSATADRLPDSRQRAQRSSDASSLAESDDEDENRNGRNRTRLAQAPVTNLSPGMGIEESDGKANPTSPGDAPMESNATRVTRSTSPANPGSGMGRSLGNMAIESQSTAASKNASPRRRNNRSDSAETGTGLATTPNTQSQASGRRTNRSAISPTMTAKTDSAKPNLARSGASGASTPNPNSKSASVSRSDADSPDPLQGSRLDVDAPEGAAGLGDRVADNAGVMRRPASRDSQQLQPNLTSRFKQREFGGTPAISPIAVIAKEAFRKREPSKMASSAEPTTEAAINLGLEFLARYQAPDGSWSLSPFDLEAIQHRNQLNSDTAATGLALLAFQGAGYNHREFKYATQIDQAINWLVEHQSDDGGLYVASDQKSDIACRLYSHGIAALALTEAYGMTQDPKLKQPAQKAIDFIIQSQDPRKGGWRYFAQSAKKSSDTSVSGWMMMALQSGRLAGLDVDPDSFESIDDWLDVAADPENDSLYRYNPYGIDANGVSRLKGRQPSESMTAVGLLMRIYSGWDKSDPRLLRGADYLIRNKLPDDSTPQLRDTYYWYYATQVLKHVDGPRWTTWNNRLRPLLIRTQEKSGDYIGSWNPYRPVPDRWGSFGGRLYVTSMNLLSLEVRHRMLPLYKQHTSENNDVKD